ncbi:Kae1-associated serine/threonine protein kinase [Candidatus Pacearchaeota archaeon]|nr:Kae1-associated serine/threonine protein kinase [Candidatus Pacearchaeota archaeon]
MKPQIIQQGAEAILIKKEFSAAQLLADSRHASSARNSQRSLTRDHARSKYSKYSSRNCSAPRAIVLKRRDAKGYRIKELDEKIRKLRTRREARLLEKAGKIICVPRVLKIDERNKEIDFEFISGDKLSESLDEMANWKEVCFAVGENIAKLHDAEIIHGDLTTSNMIWSEKEKSLYFIDFGLGFGNGRIEDKAVDLYLLKGALEAKHFGHWKEFFESVLEGYKKTSKPWKEVLKRLEKVEKRGRYKRQY